MKILPVEADLFRADRRNGRFSKFSEGA